MGGKDLKDTELLPFLRIWFQKNLKIWVPECRFTLRSVEVVKLGYFMPKPVCLKKISSATTHTSSDGVTPELPFWVCFVNSPEMTFCNMGTSVHLSPGKTFVPFFSQKLFFFPPTGHMLKIVTSKGIVPSSDWSYSVLMCTYACCYSSLLIVEFSLNECGIGANRFLRVFFLCVCVRVFLVL